MKKLTILILIGTGCAVVGLGIFSVGAPRIGGATQTGAAGTPGHATPIGVPASGAAPDTSTASTIFRNEGAPAAHAGPVEVPQWPSGTATSVQDGDSAVAPSAQGAAGSSPKILFDDLGRTRNPGHRATADTAFAMASTAVEAEQQTAVDLTVPEGVPIPAVLADLSAEDTAMSSEQETAAEKIFDGYAADIDEAGGLQPTKQQQIATDAASDADERYRALYGSDAFLRQSVRAAKLDFQIDDPDVR